MTNQVKANRDFTQHLALEILYTIFSFLPFRNRVQFTGVCKSWRRILLDWPLMWTTLDDPDCDLGKDLLPYKQYIKNDSIRHVDIKQLNVDQQTRAITFLSQLNCCSLQSLSFSFRHDMMDTFTNLLACAGQSITQINVKVQPGDIHLLERFLIHCPKLNTIKYGQKQLSPSSRDVQIQQLFHDIHVFSENLLNQQQQQQQRPTFPCLKSLSINGVAPIHQLLSDDIEMPNLRYLNVFCPNNNHLNYIRNQGWPQLRFLQLMGIQWSPNIQSDLAKAILNMPLLESVHLISNILPTNELYCAIAGLEYLQTLYIDNQRYYDHALLAEDYDDDVLETEEGLLCLLRGKCRQSLQKLQLNAVNVLTDRILDAIPDLNDRLTYLNIVLRASPHRQRQLQQRRRGDAGALLSDNGLRRFASNMSNSKMDFLGLFLELEVLSLDTISFMCDNLGSNFASDIIDADAVGSQRYLNISSDGIWSIDCSRSRRMRLR